MLELIGVIFVCVLNISLGLFALGRNPRSNQNRIFFVFSFCVVLWALSNYLANYSQNPQTIELLSRWAFGMALLVTSSIMAFSWVFPTRVKKIGWQAFLLIPVVPMLILTVSSELVLGKLVDPSSLQSTNVSSGPLYLLLMGYIIILFICSVVNFAVSYKRASFVDKTRVKIVVFGVAISFTFVAITSAILPYLTGDWTISRTGPFGTVFMVTAIAYAIIRHKLFDIRLVVARSLGYVLSVAVLALLYGLVTVTLINLILPDSTSQQVQISTYTILAAILAITFQPLKRFFDQWTNKLFYRDAYDSRELIDQINTVLVSTLELNKLLTSTSDVIAQTLKLETVLFVVKGKGQSSSRIIGFSSGGRQGVEYDEIIKSLSRSGTKTIVADELTNINSEQEKFMRRNGLAVITQLIDNPSQHKNVLGYILLGDKKSGSPYSRDDLKNLEIIADEMVIAIQNALRFEEIQNFAETLQAKVDDATRKLRRTNEKLKALDETKDEFISMASHQLRTPLTSVKGYVSMVLEGDAGKVSPQQRKLLDQAFVSSQRMVYLIADLLNVSRLRTGKFVIEAKQTNLADVIEGEVTQLVETAKARNLTLTYHKPKEFPTLPMDETKTRQVIMNFIDNAIYYTPSGGHITINLEDKGKAIEFSVADDGIGVPKSEQHHLFSKFYRAGNAKKARPDGTGLGLFMAKKVIVAQGGAVIFNSQEGKGSTFGFNFPKDKLAQLTSGTPVTEKTTVK